MRLKASVSKNSVSYSVIKDYRVNGVRTTKIVEALGNLEEIKVRAGDTDPEVWLNNYIAELTRQDKDNNRVVSLNLNPNKEITADQLRLFNGGYLFLQALYYQLGFHKICAAITKKYKFTYDLNNILAILIYARIIYPSSKMSTLKASENFIEPPSFDLHHIYRALEVLAKENSFIQSALYKNSLMMSKRNTRVIYYDCTNYYFETEEEAGLKQYGVSKENRPNPIVQMGLFMDGDGIPLLFSITPGNTNEQITLQPAEKKLLRDFELSKFIVCTDAGLASSANRRFNDTANRSFVTTQSVKKLKNYLKEWALSPDGWHLPNSTTKYNIQELDESLYQDNVFYKERWINENDIEQRLIITFSLKYRDYERNIRGKQLGRAAKLVASNPKIIDKPRQNDYKRFIVKTSVTEEGELAEKVKYSLNYEKVSEEKQYDGFYALCTNLEDSPQIILNISRRRWEIEECFRIMKDDLESRPAYLSRDDRLTAHFLTCFLALIIYRYLETKLNANLKPEDYYTVKQIIKTLRDYNFNHFLGDGYVPAYTKTAITDKLHKTFDFKTDYEIVSEKMMKSICRFTKAEK